jgi:hypothetical protein
VNEVLCIPDVSVLSDLTETLRGRSGHNTVLDIIRLSIFELCENWRGKIELLLRA